MALPNLIEALTQEGLISDTDLKSARQLQAENGGQLLEVLVRIGAADEEALLDCASRVWGVSKLEDAQIPAAAEVILSICNELGLSPAWIVRKQAAIWKSSPDGNRESLVIAACNPLDPALQEQLHRSIARIGTRGGEGPVLSWHILSRRQLDTIEAMLAGANSAANADLEHDGDLSRLRELAEEAPIIDLVNQIFSAAIKNRASDIHIEPSEKFFEIRLRIDGVVQTWQRQPASRFDAVSTRIKIISAMDIAERRLPQDGRQTIRLLGQTFDLRVSSLPGAWGESLVLRLLPKDKSLPSLGSLGLLGRSLSEFSSALHQPNGIVLVTGPTGSGKSTTLYTGLQSINDGQKKIITIEDPIEFNMDRVTQVQVKADIGLTFAAGLRSILRQDPDVIMIGEIRDPDTAKIAIQAALTGHLVLSTLHTNSSLLAIPRLIDLGLEPFQIGAAIKALAAQRLVRKVCPHCSHPVGPPEQLDLLLRACDPGVSQSILQQAIDQNWRSAQGCSACAGTGYLGRIALFEIVRLDPPTRQAVLAGKSPIEVEAAARLQGYQRLAEDGLVKAVCGQTTVSEILRVVADDAAPAQERPVHLEGQ